MADAGVVKDSGRLPWLEPYRPPQPRQGHHSTGVVVGLIALAAVVALLTIRDVPLIRGEDPAPPQASVVLPPPSAIQQPIVLPPLETGEAAAEAAAEPERRAAQPASPRRAVLLRRRITAVPARDAFREVEEEQADAPAPAASEAALAIAALPLPPDPPRPTVDRSARVVRGKTVQLGVYRTAAQAEAAWRSAVRDYTFLVTMPKSIEPISIRSRRFYRLQLGTPSKKHARQLCTNLKTTGRACTVA